MLKNKQAYMTGLFALSLSASLLTGTAHSSFQEKDENAGPAAVTRSVKVSIKDFNKLEADSKKLSAELLEYRDALSVMTGEFFSVKAELSEHKTELLEHKIALSLMNEECSSLRTELHKHKMALSGKMGDNISLTEYLIQILGHLQTVAAKNDQLTSKNKMLMHDLFVFSKEVQQLKEQLAGVESNKPITSTPGYSPALRKSFASTIASLLITHQQRDEPMFKDVSNTLRLIERV